jgi:hypothetical protein
VASKSSGKTGNKKKKYRQLSESEKFKNGERRFDKALERCNQI